MNQITEHIIEGSVTAILVFWFLTHATQFSTVAQASSDAIVGSVHALWGRSS